MDHEAAYAALASVFVGDASVAAPEPKRGKFGKNGFKVHGKVFAMWAQGALVVKLPSAEVEASVTAGRGERFTMGAGRVMREWLVVREPTKRWPDIVRRARAFVAGTL